MTIEELAKKSILILGFGTEGQATYDFLRRRWPSKPLYIADRRNIAEFPTDIAERIRNDQAATLNFGDQYLESLKGSPFDAIIKTPGIPATIDAITAARDSGSKL